MGPPPGRPPAVSSEVPLIRDPLVAAADAWLRHVRGGDATQPTDASKPRGLTIQSLTGRFRTAGHRWHALNVMDNVPRKGPQGVPIARAELLIEMTLPAPAAGVPPTT